MELHCTNCHQLLDRVATVCPACRLDLSPARETPRRRAQDVDVERDNAELLAAVVALGGDTRKPPPWRASVPLPVRPNLSVFADLETDVLPQPRHPRRFLVR